MVLVPFLNFLFKREPFPLNLPFFLNLPFDLNLPLPFNLPKNNLGSPKPKPSPPPSAPGTTPVVPLAPPESDVLDPIKKSSTFNWFNLNFSYLKMFCFNLRLRTAVFLRRRVSFTNLDSPDFDCLVPLGIVSSSPSGVMVLES